MGKFCFTSRYAFIAIFLVSLIPFSHSVKFEVPMSNDVAALQLVRLEGDAKISNGKIELNNLDNYRVGQIIYKGEVPLWDSNFGKLADFTTHFSFTIDTKNNPLHGDGIAFFLAPVGFRAPLNSAAFGLGLFNKEPPDVSQTQIVSIEFDSSASGDWEPSIEHVGINKNSIRSLTTETWNLTLHRGEPADVWVMYNSTTRNLSVFWSYGNGPNSSLSYQIDLKEVLPQWVIVGISAATGNYVERHTLESWECSSSLVIDESKEKTTKKIGLIIGLTLLVCLLIVGAGVAFVVLRRPVGGAVDKNNLEETDLTSINDDLESGAGPRRLSYKDLALATNNFSDERKLGEGGFGGVYKGHLMDLDIPIAVKRFSRGSKPGKKQYITEVKIISMLRQRNLVQLIGCCHDQGEFLLVYEFMPNGSLDYHLFGRRSQLSWTVRYKIAIGLASTLLYHHEEWEQCVLHRDIKSSNVMLDSNFNVKLGEFGLARLMDHELGPQTTGVVGTLGYLATEYASTGRASKKSDVYSFAVVALEIATGRKSVDKQLEKGLGSGFGISMEMDSLFQLWMRECRWILSRNKWSV